MGVIGPRIVALFDNCDGARTAGKAGENIIVGVKLHLGGRVVERAHGMGLDDNTVRHAGTRRNRRNSDGAQATNTGEALVKAVILNLDILGDTDEGKEKKETEDYIEKQNKIVCSECVCE